jgi:hypothetical protein
MALGAGADLAGRDSWTAFAGGIPFFDTEYMGRPEPGPWYQYLRQGWLQLTRGNGWLEVNRECEEFIPDAAHADYELHPKAIAAQHGAASYVVFDADFPTSIWKTLPPPMLDDRPMTPDDPEYPWFERFQEFMPKDWLDSVDQAIELGGIKKADTIEGLASQLKLDPEKLSAAVSAWNAKAAAGRPDEFGRLPQNMKPIRNSPYYGIKTGPLIFCGPGSTTGWRCSTPTVDPYRVSLLRASPRAEPTGKASSTPRCSRTSDSPSAPGGSPGTTRPSFAPPLHRTG